jgi:2-polyprenyl-6-methoxyphenol hydroxylase-like FAD-dependent oxidoreductase
MYFGEIGAGLQLAPNALHALDRLGLLGEVGKHAVYPSRLVWMDAIRGTPITTVDLGPAFRRRYGQPYVVMHRGDLLGVLLEACRAERLITLAADREIVSVEDRGEAARALDSGGALYETDLLIGADGLHSVVRRLVCDDAPICDGRVAYRGTLPMAEMSSHAGLDNVVMWVGPQLHFVQYPVRRAELYNQVAVFRSRRYRPDSDDWGTVDELDAQYAQTCDYVRGCVALMGRDRRWPMFDRLLVDRWVDGRLALTGDAAHPMLQYLAQGACQAIEDAHCLAAEAEKAAGDWPAALARYAEIRFPRTSRVQQTARLWGDMWHVDGVGRLMRNELFRARADTDFSRADWLYGV